MNVLEQIVGNKRKEIEAAKARISLQQLKAGLYFDRPCLSLAKSLNERAGIIAEFKRKSPSKGVIRQPASVMEITRSYALHGASACSILTDHAFFAGSLQDILDARPGLDIPVLRKEFILDPYQVYEAKSAGADLILLIAECLSGDQIRDLNRLAHDLGMEVLLEMHDESELDKWIPGIDLLGINNRDLKTFHTGIEKSLEMAAGLPTEPVWVSESGLKGTEELLELSAVGYRGFLIGETFMKAGDPGTLCGAFVNSLKTSQHHES